MKQITAILKKLPAIIKKLLGLVKGTLSAEKKLLDVVGAVAKRLIGLVRGKKENDAEKAPAKKKAIVKFLGIAFAGLCAFNTVGAILKAKKDGNWK